MAGIGASVAIIQDNQIVLVLRNDFKLWALPSGFVDPGESLVQTATREALEETGLQVQVDRLIGIYYRPLMIQGEDAFAALFRASVIGGELNQTTNETDDVYAAS